MSGIACGIPLHPVFSACRAIRNSQLYVPFHAVRNPLWHTVYVYAANVLWEFRDRDCNGLFQYRHRRADRRFYSDMEIACRRLVCACYGDKVDKGVRRYGEAVFMLRLIFFEWTFSSFYVILLKMSFRGT